MGFGVQGKELNGNKTLAWFERQVVDFFDLKESIKPF